MLYKIYLQIKVYEKEKRITVLKFPLIYKLESFSSISANLYEGKGLKNIKQVLEKSILEVNPAEYQADFIILVLETMN